MLMSGPLLTGYTQTINDYYDKEIDAINEPNRPIPSGLHLHTSLLSFLSSASKAACLDQASAHVQPHSLRHATP